MGILASQTHSHLIPFSNLNRIIAIAVGFGLVGLFLFVPETFWDRTPVPKSRRPPMARRSISNLLQHPLQRSKSETNAEDAKMADIEKTMTPRQLKLHDLNAHARFAAPGPTGLDDVQEHRPKFLSNVPLQSPTTTTQPIEATGTGSEMPHLHD